MRNRVYIFVNGILTRPSDTQGWTDRACRWIDSETSFKAESYEYFSGALTRRLFQAKRVAEVARIVAQLSSMDIVLVGHSNGCDIISRLLLNYRLMLKEIHMVAGACERDCRKNGINAAIKTDRVEHCFVYASKKDSALKLAGTTGKVLSWFGLGYGTLGLEGPANVSDKMRVHTYWREFDHSEWWEPEHFEKTMELITGGAA